MAVAATARLAGTLPLFAYRGLWDKFAGPGTEAAIRRAYRRGVSCVLRASETTGTLSHLCALVGDVAVNRCSLPLYLAQDRQGPAMVQRLLVWSGIEWALAGAYVPVRAIATLAIDDFAFLGAIRAPLVAVESSNVLEAWREAETLGGITDEDAVGRVRGMVAGDAALVRVSDFVELDQLDRQQEVP